MKKVKNEKRFKSRLGSFLMFIILKTKELFSFFSGVFLLRFFEKALKIKNMIKNSTSEAIIIMLNEIKFEIYEATDCVGIIKIVFLNKNCF